MRFEPLRHDSIKVLTLSSEPWMQGNLVPCGISTAGCFLRAASAQPVGQETCLTAGDALAQWLFSSAAAVLVLLDDEDSFFSEHDDVFVAEHGASPTSQAGHR